MANWEAISNSGMCTNYTSWFYRKPGEHPCPFTETFAGTQYDNQDKPYTEIRTLRCPLMRTVVEQVDEYATQEASEMFGRPVSIACSDLSFQQPEDLTPDMGDGCLWGQRGLRPIRPAI